ncbi:hypothetical protein GOB93_07565 [Acetobacter musti]|uniref:Glycosyltransferase 2-like domain-containing protein n=1 Tax=Acetobacter musti TaxID=864732 RepID=A0ABX0JPS2_9PROT|nr:glycosyltransferase family 2 protein [Acetobacter musti]NHN84501.1 hypothetical protein [Acetobacter musti]
MKTAVCLVVKNEDTEIVYWIAWYKALGFDSFIIYDDFSDDATDISRTAAAAKMIPCRL